MKAMKTVEEMRVAANNAWMAYENDMGDDFLAFTDAFVAAFEPLLEAERERNAALVAAAELVIKRNWERINGDGSDYSLFSQAIGNLGDALAANEKGEVQG